jgi:hypothetical protein
MEVRLSTPQRQRQRDQHQWDSDPQSLELHPARLSPNLRQFGRIFDLLPFIAQLARTSRR